MPEIMIQPKGYLYEKPASKSRLVDKPSTYHRSRGYTETPLYAGPTVSAIGNELLSARKMNGELAQLVGKLSLALSEVKITEVG